MQNVPIFTYVLFYGFVSGQDRVPTPPDFSDLVNPDVLYFHDRSSESEFRCQAVGNPEISYKWTKDGRNLDLGSFGRRIVTTAHGSFTLKNPKPEDAGVYQCRAKNSLGEAVGKPIRYVRAYLNQAVDPHHLIARLRRGTQYHVTCKRPGSAPEAHVSWVTAPDPSAPHQVNTPNSSRLAVTRRGDIYFQAVNVFSDDTGLFKCVSFNPVLNEYRFGPSFEFVVTDVLDSELNYDSSSWSEMFYSPREITVKKGRNLDLYCIVAGIRVDPPQWFKYGGTIDVSRVDWGGNHNKSITIENIDFADGGLYGCTFSSQPRLDRNFSVKVESAPEWVNEHPKNTNRSAGSTDDAVFDCSVRGVPKPSVRFFRNGLPFQADAAHQIETPVLIVKSSSPSAVYQCEAKNVHGVLWTNFYFNSIQT